MEDAGLWAVLGNMERRFSESLMRLQWEFHNHRQSWEAEKQSWEAEKQSLQAELQSIRTELEGVQKLISRSIPKPLAAPRVAAEPGMAFIAGFARQALAEAGVDSGVALLLQEPLQPRKVAAAHNMARQVLMQDSDLSCSAGIAIRNLRDLLVLTVCVDGGPWNYDSFKEAMREVSDQPLEPDVESQLALSFNTIIRLANDRDACDKHTHNTYGEAVDKAAADALFAAYVSCALRASGHQSKSKIKSKPRTRRNRPSRARASYENAGVDPSDIETALEEALSAAFAEAEEESTCSGHYNKEPR